MGSGLSHVVPVGPPTGRAGIRVAPQTPSSPFPSLCWELGCVRGGVGVGGGCSPVPVPQPHRCGGGMRPALPGPHPVRQMGADAGRLPACPEPQHPRVSDFPTQDHMGPPQGPPSALPWDSLGVGARVPTCSLVLAPLPLTPPDESGSLGLPGAANSMVDVPSQTGHLVPAGPRSFWPYQGCRVPQGLPPPWLRASGVGAGREAPRQAGKMPVLSGQATRRPKPLRGAGVLAGQGRWPWCCGLSPQAMRPQRSLSRRCFLPSSGGPVGVGPETPPPVG